MTEQPHQVSYLGVVVDSIGHGILVLGRCPHCDLEDQLVVRYRVKKDGEWHPPEWITPKSPNPKTVIMDFTAKQPTIGFTCGCYAKLHRQIAHISDRVKKKGNS